MEGTRATCRDTGHCRLALGMDLDRAAQSQLIATEQVVSQRSIPSSAGEKSKVTDQINFPSRRLVVMLISDALGEPDHPLASLDPCCRRGHLRSVCWVTPWLLVHSDWSGRTMPSKSKIFVCLSSSLGATLHRGPTSSPLPWGSETRAFCLQPTRTTAAMACHSVW